MKRWILSLAIVVALLAGALSTHSAQAADNSPVLSRIVKQGEFRVGMTGTQPPFCVKSKTGKLIGYEVDLATMLAKAMGVELKLVEMPFAELLPALEKGKVDAVMSGMTMTPQRNLKAAFVGPYLVSGKSILTKDKTLAAIEEAEEIDRAEIRLAALEQSTSQEFVEKVLSKTTLVKVPDYDAGVKMVLEDEVAALVADFPICMLSVLRHPESGLVTLAVPLTIEPIGMALPPGDALLLNMMENMLGALEGVGILVELEAYWFEDGSWLSQLP